MIGKTHVGRGRRGGGRGTEEGQRRFMIWRMEDLEGKGGYERGNDWSRPRFDGRRKTRGGGPPTMYGQKRR